MHDGTTNNKENDKNNKNKLKIWILVNFLISFLMFLYIFKSLVGVSGGDIAMYIYNILFGILQISVVSFLIRKKEDKYNIIILLIMLFQVIEILILYIWGYQINEYFKTIL